MTTKVVTPPRSSVPTVLPRARSWNSRSLSGGRSVVAVVGCSGILAPRQSISRLRV
jgi:hypothetical protein